PTPTYDADYPAELYALLHGGNQGDREFYRRVCAGAQRILELGCGDGRILRALEPAPRVAVGLDLHDGLLRRARRLAVGLPHLRFVRGDMRAPADALEAPNAAGFDRILVPHGGLFCMLHPEDLDGCLHAAYALLSPGGELVFDVWAADDFHAQHDPEEQD